MFPPPLSMTTSAEQILERQFLARRTGLKNTLCRFRKQPGKYSSRCTGSSLLLESSPAQATQQEEERGERKQEAAIEKRNCLLATRQPRPACLRNLHQFPSSSINLPPELRFFTTNIKHEPCLWPRPASYVRADERTSSTQRDETAGRPELLTTYRIGS